ncbi:hypothetical protein IGI47_001359 [Enterococcus sp. AZ191]
MPTYMDLLKAEKKALNKLFVREFTNARKESQELEQLKQKITKQIDYGNSKN